MTAEQPGIPADAVVVGIDGSERDRTCITWAAGAATRAGKGLHLLHAHDVAIELAASDPIGARGLAIGVDVEDDQILPGALSWVQEQWPHLTITVSDPWSSPERALIDASREAHLIVVGSRQVSGLEKLLLGRSALAVAMHSTCPVVLLPDGARTDAEGPVLVGIDGSPHSQEAAERAFWIAKIRGTSVRGVVGWYLEIVDGMVVTTPGTPAWDAVEDKYRAMVDQVLAPIAQQYPDVPYDIEVRRGPAPDVLTEASAEASLLVMGSRGRGGFRGMLLGSVTHKVIETAACPVMVVRLA